MLVDFRIFIGAFPFLLSSIVPLPILNLLATLFLRKSDTDLVLLSPDLTEIEPEPILMILPPALVETGSGSTRCDIEPFFLSFSRSFILAAELFSMHFKFLSWRPILKRT